MYNQNKPPSQEVTVTNRVSVQPTFNDYAQTALLSATLHATSQTNALLAQQASAARLQWWKSVVLDRDPDLTDPMEIEDRARGLMAWDARETAAHELRMMGAHLRSRLSTGEMIQHILLYAVSAIVSIPGVWLISTFVIMVPDSGKHEEWLHYQDEIILGWLGLFVFLILWDPVSGRFIGYKPIIEDPRRHSEICRRFYPGGKVTSTSGKTYTVSNWWPTYVPERLRFWVFVEEATDETVQFGPQRLTALPSEIVVWE